VLQVAAAGTLPEDGFTGYPDGGGFGVARWGDYNTSIVTSDGAIWMVVQYIGSFPRTDFANWNTYIVRVQP
jgi:predicted pyridoxine 5'-phosphate oxidase superfamily flavin-nucleotide-binding protein